MPPMAMNSIVMFALGMNVFFKLKEKDFEAVPENVWRQWIDNPQERKGRIGEIITFVTKAETIEDCERLFSQLIIDEVAHLERDLRIMGIAASAAPLIGLLGTVTGILSLFAALARGTGGDETMKLISQGVSEALIATQTGLMIAIPGLSFHHYLTRRQERYKAFLSRLETICMQRIYKKVYKLETVSVGERE